MKINEETTVSEEQVLFNKLNYEEQQFILKQMKLLQPCELRCELEEPKGIPEKICTNRIINTKDILEFEMIQNKINAEYTYAINWILDYLKSKGE